MKKVDVIIKYLLWGFIFLNGVIYFLNAQKLAIQQAFFSKYKNYQYIGEDDLVCITHIFAVVVELANSILNTQLVLNVIVLILFYIYIKLNELPRRKQQGIQEAVGYVKNQTTVVV